VLGVKHIDMPCTPFKVWQAIKGATLDKADGRKLNGAGQG
jgi:hypothetical protein